MRNWYVITGGPSAGKTMLIKALEEAGFHVEHESARIVIDEKIAKGMTIEEIRSDEAAFQKEVYFHKMDREKKLNPTELIFFDRGIQDSVAYLKLKNFSIEGRIEEEMERSEYKKVFLLEPFAYEADYARTESKEEQDRLFSLLKETYERSHIPVRIIPPFPTKAERIAYFFNYLKENEGISVAERPVL